METVAHENSKRNAPERARILACAIGRAKEAAISESRVIARVAYLCEIKNIGSDHSRKLLKEGSREGQDISVRDWVRKRGCRFRNARNWTVAYLGEKMNIQCGHA